MNHETQFDAVVVGAGFAGLYMLHRLRTQGFTACVIEAGAGVGGTWYWNRYPGARCDVESVEYSYSFSPELEQEWTWTERYATQPEILRYLDHVADRFDLRRHIRFETKVVAADWDEAAERWQVRTDKDNVLSARFCIMATGNLSVVKLPDWPGIEDFEGPIYHTGQWPHEPVAFEGKKVGVVGTGSSGMQVIPRLAESADDLVVFQRTPSFAVPANNVALTPDKIAEVKANYPVLRERMRQSFLGFGFFAEPGPPSAKADSEEERQRVLERGWNGGSAGLLMSYADLLVDEESNAAAAEFARGKIRDMIRDPQTARRMTPAGYPIGSRRLCCQIDYFDSINRPNVTLVDVRETPVTQVGARRVTTSEGSFELDALVLATGFHAMTGALTRIAIKGRDGRTLADEWADGPRTYLGLMVAGFPNLLMITGPGSPSVLSNVVLSIEQHVEWIADCLVALRDRGATMIEPAQEAEDAWLIHVDEIARTTLFPRSASWYQGRTRDGRPIFMPYVGGVGPYRAKCDAVAAAGYEGFLIAGESVA